MINSVLNSPDFFVIDQTPEYTLGAIWEQVYLIDKKRNLDIFLAEFDGVTDLGLIDKNNRWSIAAYDKVVVWKDNKISVIDKIELKNVEEVTLVADNVVMLGVDTLNLNMNKAEWLLDISTMELTKKD